MTDTQLLSRTAAVSHPKIPEPIVSAPSHRALRLPQVCKITGLGRSAIYEMQAERRFPQRIKLTDRAVGWLAQRTEASRNTTTPSK